MEKITAAAIWYKEFEDNLYDRPNNIDSGTVITGFDHGDCAPTSRWGWQIRQDKVEGFVTTENRFVTRSEALQIAKTAGQSSGV